MCIRGLALGLSFAIASVAQAGVEVKLEPNIPPPYTGGQPVRIDIILMQTPVGSDHSLRLIQFDFSNSDASLGLRPYLTQSPPPPAPEIKPPSEMLQ